ncbi:MAG: oligoendopeptidase F [Proteobacteria bacterium]|nr:oligoendopeptidase F [Pseudomonadota bacterium]
MISKTNCLILSSALVAGSLGACQPACPPAQPCPAVEACHAPVMEEEANMKEAQAAEAVQAAEAAQAAAPKVGVKTRSELDSKYLWKKDRLFPAYADFKAAIKDTAEKAERIAECKDIASAKALKDCLSLYFETHTAINKLTLYANMTDDTEPSPEVKSDQTQANNVLNRFMELSKGIRDSILKLDDVALEKYFAEEPDLKAHEPYIRNIMRRSGRVLSDDAERVLALAGDNLWAEIDLNEIHSNSENVFDAMLDEMQLPVIKDDQGKDVQLTLSNYTKFRRSADRNVRKAAVDGLMGTLAKYENVFANAYVGQMQNDILFARARKYNTALEAYLDKDGIPVELYHNLIKTVGENLEPLHRYVALRKKILGLSDVHLYDMYIPLSEGVEKSYTYDEAVDLITKALAPLGDEYITRLKVEMDPAHGSIDLLPHADKRSGAYSCSVYGIDPFILINYQDSLDDVSTLAHELGHSMHSIYSMQNQPASSYHYTMFLAEIASTTNESLLNDYLYKNAASDAEKIDLLVDKLENIRGTIYRQTLFAEFEYLAHTAVENGTAVQAQWLDELYASLIAKYYGPEYTIDEFDSREWAYIPHFYYKYYVYSYATGLSSALSFASLIEQGPENAQKYLTMLKSGCAKDSVTLLKEAGVDLTTPAPIEFALKEFDNTLNELEALLNKK